MTVQLIMEYYTNHTLPNKFQETDAVEEAASGLQTIEKLIKLLSPPQSCSPNAEPSSMDSVETVANMAVSKFKNVVSLLSRNRTRTGHARFRRAPLPSETIVYRATPLQQIPPLIGPINEAVEKNKIIDFSYSSANSFMSSLTGDAVHVSSSLRKPCVSSCSLKRKCESENFGSGKCGSSSRNCHCSKKRYMILHLFNSTSTYELSYFIHVSL